MKRLVVLLIVAVLVIQYTSIFSSEAHAQSTPTVTNEQLVQHVGNGVFRSVELALSNELTAINSRRNTPGYQTELQTNTAERAALNKAKDEFTIYLRDHENVPVKQRYSDALLAANMSLANSQNNNTLLKSGLGKTFIDNLTTQLGAESRSTEWIGSITSGTTLSQEAQQNAAAATGAANPSKKTIDPESCSLINGNLLTCIDELITWIIKNTLLQLAGFLVWLTSNMLNYAIQTSILDFSKWAPNTLYAIWIIIRQIVSLAVVFAGLYLGFMYIIGREDTFGKYIGWLVMFALFVNFSYPITRALVDISNIVSLNVYQAAVGSEPLSGTSNNTAGGLIMNKLGLQGLLASATEVKTTQAGFVKDIKSTPGALLAVAFVAYAAYVFFMATAIIAVRTAVLVFLIVASPILLLDAVIPKMGDVAVKMRKMFFEQLIVAPVFMIMLALTLRFMDVFQSTGPNGEPGPLSAATATGLTGGADSVKVFFGILMMLIMLHIMLKVTKSVAGAAGELATKTMGKVGGFGLGVASGGAGLLARGSIGAASARLRDSTWMKNAQDSRTGRGLYSLTNSLAQSTYDTRNIGMVSKGMATAGMGMGQGLKQNYDQKFQANDKAIREKASYITDTSVRNRYLDQMTNTVASRVQRGTLKAFGLRGDNARSDAEITKAKLATGQQKILDRYNAFKDDDRKREFLESQTDDVKEMLRRGSVSIDDTTVSTQTEGVGTTSDDTIPKGGVIDTVHPGGSDFNHLNNDYGSATPPSGPGGSNTSGQSQSEHPAPVSSGPTTSPQATTPGFLMTAEEKIRQRASDQANTQQAPAGNMKTDSFAKRRQEAAAKVAPPDSKQEPVAAL